MPIYRQPSSKTLPASGKSVANPGRIAAGAPGIAQCASVFPANTISVPSVSSNRPGGLIDKKQQANPQSTAGQGHPFDGTSGYMSVSTQPQTPALDNWNGEVLPTDQTPEIAPYEHGTFFQKKVTPVIKTVGGTNQSGVKSDTSFHPRKKMLQARPATPSSVPTEIRSRAVHPPSFATHNILRYDPNNSSSSGRWATVKRSANESAGACQAGTSQ